MVSRRWKKTRDVSAKMILPKPITQIEVVVIVLTLDDQTEVRRGGTMWFRSEYSICQFVRSAFCPEHANLFKNSVMFNTLEAAS